MKKFILFSMLSLFCVSNIQSSSIRQSFANSGSRLSGRFFDSGSMQSTGGILISDQDRNNILQFALNQYDQRTFDFARSLGASFNFNAVDNLGQTKLFKDLFRYLCVEFLIKNGTDLNVQDFEGKTVLHYAVINKLFQIVYSLISHKINVNLQDHNGKTALHYAMSDGLYFPGMVRLLIDESDVNINIKDNEGNTALHGARQAEKEEFEPACNRRQKKLVNTFSALQAARLNNRDCGARTQMPLELTKQLHKMLNN